MEHCSWGIYRSLIHDTAFADIRIIRVSTLFATLDLQYSISQRLGWAALLGNVVLPGRNILVIVGHIGNRLGRKNDLAVRLDEISRSEMEALYQVLPDNILGFVVTFVVSFGRSFTQAYTGSYLIRGIFTPRESFLGVISMLESGPGGRNAGAAGGEIKTWLDLGAFLGSFAGGWAGFRGFPFTRFQGLAGVVRALGNSGIVLNLTGAFLTVPIVFAINSLIGFSMASWLGEAQWEEALHGLAAASEFMWRSAAVTAVVYQGILAMLRAGVGANILLRGVTLAALNLAVDYLVVKRYHKENYSWGGRVGWQG